MGFFGNFKLNRAILFGALISCFIAFANHYPLVYPDTGTYIYSGFSGLVFPDRPIFYGLFLRHVSLASSLWYVIFAQGLIVSYTLYTTIGMFIEGKRRNAVFIGVITFLTLMTGFSYTVSILIPDVFCAVAILSLINLLFSNRLNTLHTSIQSVLFVFSICTHFSNVIITGLILAGFLIYYISKFRTEKVFIVPLRNLVVVLGLFSASVALIPTVHFAFSKQFRISGASHVFFMNHLLETGILEDYLATACETKNYRICEYKDRLGWDFIWSPESAFAKTGGWAPNEKEYNTIIKEVLTTPRYLVLLVQKNVEYTFKLFFDVRVTVSAPQLKSSAPFGQINWHFKDTLREYHSSLQNQSQLETSLISFLQQFIVLLSISFLGLFFLSKSLLRKIDLKLKCTVGLLFFHSVINAAICSSFSTVDPRYQSRIAWLLPFCAILVILKLKENRTASNPPHPGQNL